MIALDKLTPADRGDGLPIATGLVASRNAGESRAGTRTGSSWCTAATTSGIGSNSLPGWPPTRKISRSRE